MRPKTVKEILAMPDGAIVNGFHGRISDVKKPFPQTAHDEKRGRVIQLVLVEDMDGGADRLTVALEDPQHHVSPQEIGAEIGLEASNTDKGLRGLLVNRFTAGDGTEKLRLMVEKNSGARVVLPAVQRVTHNKLGTPGSVPPGPPTGPAPTPSRHKTKTRAMAEHLHYCVGLVDWVECDDLRQRYATTLFIQSARDCLGDADRDVPDPPALPQEDGAVDEVAQEREIHDLEKLVARNRSPEPEPTAYSDSAGPDGHPEEAAEPSVDAAFATLMLTAPFHGRPKEIILAAIEAMEKDIMESGGSASSPEAVRQTAKREILMEPDMFASLVDLVAPEEPAPPVDATDMMPPARGPRKAEFEALTLMGNKVYGGQVVEEVFTSTIDPELDEEAGYLQAVDDALQDPAKFIAMLRQHAEEIDDIPF
jgi:hypothetical protein